MIEQYTKEVLESYGAWAAPFSIMLNILISIFGFIPSVFLTAANIKLFGLFYGTVISIAGEAIGAVVAFFLYRRGFQNMFEKKTTNHPGIRKLLYIEGKEAFWLILSLRLLPFVPSGAVTLFAALGKVSALQFAIASTLGKIPALLLEAYSAYQIVNETNQAKWILGAIALLLLFHIWRKYRN
ncbi:MAG: TVP38/TMEM64 family protein [Ectobacillus sp.]